ncbi:unnamed protein product [marine sediment metagenome]|uniref:Uncharacterized protein n=1 Tax=marine sediment metagenome TaxID=412755 RepID=X0XKJ1_9ZZZZ
MKRRALLALLLLGFVAVIAQIGADEAGILEVRGRNAKEKGYPIGKVEFLDVTLADSLCISMGERRFGCG